MIKRAFILFAGLFLMLSDSLFAQSESNLDNKILFRKEWSCYGFVHTEGWGIGFRSGKHKTYLRKHMWEVEFSTMKHPKEKRVTSYFDNYRSYIFGKLNSVYLFRGGYGVQRVLNGKPYWGGVELRWFFYGGATLGITKSVYLYVMKYNAETNLNEIVAERYDPNQHMLENIVGRGPYFKGFNHMGIYPGVYAKTGLNFEYGVNDALLKAIECGVTFDYMPLGVPIMAYNNKSNYFLSLYLGLHLGKRTN